MPNLRQVHIPIETNFMKRLFTPTQLETLKATFQTLRLELLKRVSRGVSSGCVSRRRVGGVNISGLRSPSPMRKDPNDDQGCEEGGNPGRVTSKRQMHFHGAKGAGLASNMTSSLLSVVVAVWLIVSITTSPFPFSEVRYNS